MGFSFSGSASNAGMMFIDTKPAEQRRGKGHSAADIVADLSPKLQSLMFAPNGGLVAIIRASRGARAWAALAASSSCCRIRAATRSATWTVWPTRL